MKRIIFLIAIIYVASINIFSQAIPKQVSYQGVLKDASGNLVNGDQAMTFKIYNEATGGSALWTEIQAVSVANGLFSVQLGSTNPITTVPFDRIHFLGITVGTGSELTPRTLLTPSPYSFMAMNVLDNTVVKSLNGLKDNVNLVGGTNVTLVPSGNNLTINASSGGTGSVTQVNTGAGLTGGPVTTTGTISITTGGVTSAMIQDATITGTDIANSTIGAEKLNFTAGGIGGSGTTNYIPKFTAATTLGNSVIFQDASNKVGIGTITPEEKLHVKGYFLLEGADFMMREPTRGNGGRALVHMGSNTNDDKLILNFAGDFEEGVNVQGPKLVVENEIQASRTGDANLVPIAYANVNSNGTINTAATTSNVTLASHGAGSGNYYFKISGESIYFTNYVCIATLNGTSGEIMWSSAGGELYIGTLSSSGSATDKAFTFVLYKK